MKNLFRYLHLIACFIVVAFGLLISGRVPSRAQTQVKPISILDALARSRTVLYAQAHPDDETSIAAFLSRAAGAGKRVYMVCFTRGENEPMSVGQPKGEKMAQARMQWLRDSAAILGAESVQLPYTDGPSTVDELERGVIRYWPRTATTEEVLAQWRKIDRDPYEDMVRVIREKRPDLIVTWEQTQGWTGNSEHRTVSWLAQRAFIDAADPNVFPVQIEQGLQPWQPQWLFSVLRGQGDIFGSYPMETLGCEAPALRGRNACEAKAEDLIAYKRHTMPNATPEQLALMSKPAVNYVKAHPEHVQFTLQASEKRPQ